MSTQQESPPATDNPYAAPRAKLADTGFPGPSPRLRWWFLRSFWTSFVLAMLTCSLLFAGGSLEVFLLSLLCTLIAVIVQLAMLGLVAASIGKSAVLWIFAAIVFAPFGYLIAYSRLTSLIEPDDEIDQSGEAPGTA
jgi:hypothetical protein